MLIDIHSHNPISDARQISILCPGLPINISSFENTLISAGIHPWYADKFNNIEDLWHLKNVIDNKQVIAIGECGLDKLKGPPIEIQLRIFEFQASLAEKFNKPLIIHCVKAFEQIIQTNKKLKPTVPWIIHGFRKGSELMHELCNLGFRISFGTYILTNNEQTNNVLKNINLQNFFLETDTDSTTQLQKLYEYVAQLRNISVNELEAILETNFKRDFIVN